MAKNTFRLILFLVIVSESVSYGQKTTTSDHGNTSRSSTKVEIGNSLFLTKIFLDQDKLINEFRSSKDSLGFSKNIDSLFAKYHSAWNDCFSYPKENLHQLHWDYANSTSTRISDRTKILQGNTLDSIAKQIMLKVKEVSGKSPSGNHFIVFMLDNDEFNMGGCDKNLMYVNLHNRDFSLDWFKRVFPHEMNHQIYEETLPNANSDLILWSIIDEGFASYFERLINGGTVAESISISQIEYEWCLAHEKEIFEKTVPVLLSTKKDDEMLLRNEGGLLNESPGQLNYFLGYRIIEKYVEKYGKDSWRDVYTTPVIELLEKSDYKESILKKR